MTTCLRTIHRKIKDVMRLLSFSLLLPLRAATIKGVVIDTTGAIVPDAQVEIANPYEAISGVPRTIKADKNGMFTWDALAPGFYMVFASKQQDYFGDTRLAIFASDLKIPEINILVANEMVDVTVDIGRPGCLIDGLVIDTDTKQPLPNAVVRAYLDQQPDKYTSLVASEDGHFQMLLPSRSVVLSVDRSGYLTSRTRLVLDPAKHRSITVALNKADLPKTNR